MFQSRQTALRQDMRSAHYDAYRSSNTTPLRTHLTTAEAIPSNMSVAAAAFYPGVNIHTRLSTKLETSVHDKLLGYGLPTIVALVGTIIAIEGFFRPKQVVESAIAAYGTAASLARPVFRSLRSVMGKVEHVLIVESLGLPPAFLRNAQFSAVMWYLEYLQQKMTDDSALSELEKEAACERGVGDAAGGSGGVGVCGAGAGACVGDRETLRKPGLGHTCAGGNVSGPCSVKSLRTTVLAPLRALAGAIKATVPRSKKGTVMYANYDGCDLRSGEMKAAPLSASGSDVANSLRYTSPIAGQTQYVMWRGHHIAFSMHSEVKVLNNAEKPTSRDAVIITLRCTSPILMEFNEQATREYQNFLYMRQQKPQLYKVARASNGQMTVTATPWTNTTRIARVAMSKDQRSELMKWLDTFKNNAEWYHSTGRAYKLSVLTWGPPGTGKTLLGKAICGYLGVNIAGLNLSVFRNDAELDEVLSKIPKGTALAFDDLDAHCEGLKPREIVKREAKEREERKAAGKEHDALSPHQGVTLSRFLRLLDGDDEDGRITIASTNFPNLMDSAVTRAGRFDVSIHMKPCTEETVRFLYREFYKVDLPDDCMPNLQLYRELNPAEVEGAMMMNRDDAIAGAAAIRDLKPRELEVDDADLMFRIDEDATAEYRQRVLAQQANQLSESVSNLHAAFPLSSNDE